MMRSIVLVGAILISQSVAAQCDITLPRAQFVTCMSMQQQQQTGSYPHQSTFQAPSYQQQPQSGYMQPAPIYQQPAPTYQQPAPTYQQPPALWVPVDRRSTYR